MIHKKKIVAIIPARGGSKGIPRKNIIDLGGIPLIAWTIRAAHNSKYIDRVILSSDNDEICDVARQYNCEIPFIRPKELANDDATSAQVVLHALEQLGDSFDIIILLQPTSPFRTEFHIDEAIEQYVNNEALSVASATLLNKSPEWLFSLDSENTLKPLLNSSTIVTRRQDSKKAYYLNGAIYVFKRNAFINHPYFIDEQTQAYVMDEPAAQDIDTIDDLVYAQFILSKGIVGVRND